MKVTIQEMQRVYCVWSGCSQLARWNVYADSELDGEYCKDHARRAARRREKEAQEDA
jgi:hypothetical protein